MGGKKFIEDTKSSINENKGRIKYSKFVLFLGLILVGSIILSGAVNAATVPVTPGSNAIKNAINTAHSGDTLNLSAGTYQEHDIQVNKNLTITGPTITGNNPPTAVIDGQNQGRVFNISSGVKVTLKYLLIKNGNATTDTAYPYLLVGGGIANYGTLNVENCTITKNTATNGNGGGISNGDQVTLGVGGNYNGGTLNVTDSNIYNNTASNLYPYSGGSGGGVGRRRSGAAPAQRDLVAGRQPAGRHKETLG